ncbi:hypothetical protein O2N63_13375 [Aliiroseovarius sp. KMU-50]|uniref:Uncharacterized protein n=1 Tax=Aliiroseovarius salicola TaxID=3009082 RepID=A0ABT4W3T1_9RHOB|nr:hypothetical protein [Aliiroseovarius sp. KMU-50]MDA5095074.1 hypothetical protein [Aliiroseovarius sp. KMU-50]
MPLLDLPLTPPPKIKLSRLRDIGWSIWDPIGLLRSEQKWDDKECLTFADEYDGYLVQAAGQLRRGAPDSDVVDYLVQIESEHMGLGTGNGALNRAKRVVDAIHADKELWTYPE